MSAIGKIISFTLSVSFFVLQTGRECSAQIATPLLFQTSAGAGFPSRETQVKGPLYHYTFSVGTQYDAGNLYGYYGLGGYYPSLGVTVGIYDYDGAVFPGGTPYSNHYSLSVHYEQTFWDSGRWSLHYLLENGLGYTSNTFDYEKNPESTFGGHYHTAFHMGVFLSCFLTDHIKLSLGPSYSHHSNSKTHYINTGCDAVSAEIALTYAGQRVQKQTGNVSLESMGVRRRYWDIHYGACITGGGAGVTDTWRYVSHKVNAAHLWRTCRRAAFGAGADAFFDKGGNENRNAFGISGAVDYFLTRNLLLSGRVGAYLNGKADNGSWLYETIGLTYSLDGSKWYVPYVGCLTKANAGKAENLELVVGFRFGKSPSNYINDET